MKKKVGKVKRFIAMLMVGITLSSSVFYSYSMPAHAAAIVPTVEMITEALMTIFGYSHGLGKSISSVSNGINSSIFDSVYSGSAIDVGSYGVVDFSDGASIYDFLSFAQDVLSRSIVSPIEHHYLSQLDYLSYKNTGTVASESMLKDLNTLLLAINLELQASPENSEAYRSALVRGYVLNAIVPLLSPGSGDDGEDPRSTPLAWRVIAGLLAAFTAVSSVPLLSDGTVDEEALAVPENSEFVDYENFLVNQYFTGYEDTVKYMCFVNRTYYGPEGNTTPWPATFKYVPFDRNERNIYLVLNMQTDFYTGKFYSYPSKDSLPVELIKEDGSIVSQPFVYAYPVGDYRECDENGLYVGYVNESFFYSTNVPCFFSKDAAAAYFSSGDDSGMLNKNPVLLTDPVYSEIPDSTIPEYVVDFMTKTPTIEDVSELADALTELSPDTIGTTQHIPSVEDVIQSATDALPEVAPGEGVQPPVDNPTDDGGGGTNHSFDFLDLLNGLLLLIMILITLLGIFLHLMIFIVNIFKIPASTGYLDDNMVLGLDYIKTLEITGVGLSVYDFMMGLVYILMVFGVVKVLRVNIHHIKIPKSMRGGFFS